MSDFTLYFADEKDLFDLFASAQMKLTAGVLRDLALDRGIVIAPSTSREDIVQIFSQLTNDYYDLQLLVDASAKVRRRAKKCALKVDTNISGGDFSAILRDIRDLRLTRPDEVLELRGNVDDGLVLNVKFDEYDYTQTRLKQKQGVEGDIRIEKTETGYEINYPALPRLNDVSQAIVERLQQKDAAASEKRILLSRIVNASKRTEFFIGLIQCISGYRVTDVAKVRVQSPDADEDMDSDFRMTEEDAEAASLVRGVMLEGRGLLNSEEFLALRQKEYSLNRVVWLCVEIAGDKTQYELEVMISPESADGELAYLVRGQYNYNERTAKFATTRRPCDALRSRRIEGLLVEASWNVFAKLL